MNTGTPVWKIVKVVLIVLFVLFLLIFVAQRLIEPAVLLTPPAL